MPPSAKLRFYAMLGFMRRKNYDKSDILYNPSDEYLQSLLRVALYEVWNSRCHWCGDAISNPAVAEIDHVVPEAKYEGFRVTVAANSAGIYSESFLESMSTMPDSPHEVVNLAPICPRHNRTKSSTIDEDTLGPIVTSLKKSRVLSDKVCRRVLEMVNAKGLSSSFVDLIALPGDQETRQIVDTWGKAVTSALWRYDRKLLEDFRIPRDIDLDLDEGVIPDWFGQATKTGTGLDGRLELTLDEHAALEGAIVLYNFANFGTALSNAIKEAAEGVDGEVEQTLQNKGVDHVGAMGPRFASLDASLIRGSEPRLDVRVALSATLGGQAVLDYTDLDGHPILADRWQSFECVITCSTDFTSRDFEYQYEITVLDDNLGGK